MPCSRIVCVLFSVCYVLQVKEKNVGTLLPLFQKRNTMFIRSVPVLYDKLLIFGSYWLAGFQEEVKFRLFEGSRISKKGWQTKKAK